MVEGTAITAPTHIGAPKVRKPRKPNQSKRKHDEENDSQGFTDATQADTGAPKVRKAKQPKRAKPERNEEDGENRHRPTNSLYINIADDIGLETKDVKAVFSALFERVVAQLREERKFVIPNIVLFNLKETAARVSKAKKIGSKEFQTAAKPSGTRIKPLILKPLKTAVNE